MLKIATINFFCIYCSIKAYKSFGQKVPVMLQGERGTGGHRAVRRDGRLLGRMHADRIE